MVQWHSETLSFDAVRLLLNATVYGYQPSPDGTLLVWNKETADSVSRVMPGQYMWLSDGVLFVTDVKPVEPVATFEEWISRMAEPYVRPVEDAISREEGFYRLQSAAEQLTAAIQNPAPAVDMALQFAIAMENLRKVVIQVSANIPKWGNDK
ncbi:MAG: hypothetical protein ACRDCY_18005 [Aeromonas veronii]